MKSADNMFDKHRMRVVAPAEGLSACLDRALLFPSLAR
jgi:hypothetical protein